MDQKKLYGRWNFWEEFVGYPMMIFYWIKGEKISKMLSKRIEKAKQKSSQISLTDKKRNEFLIRYEKLDNFFTFHFKNIDASRNHNFEEKIEYCLEQYRRESLSILSSSNLMKLQGNFLNGAETTLLLYFALEGKVKREIRLSDIMIGENSSQIFIAFLKGKKFIDENHNLIVDQKSSFIRIHRFLKDNHIINPDFQDTTIIEAMENEYNSNFDKGTFSRAITVKPNDFEETIYQELSKLFNIKY
ncbi:MULTISPECIES: hypothetical protein [Chryseobacterium group]|jgi:hypothetical protein|uniref:Uncharacterized protein n=1 Tax=Epilithonimonas ginsengisoli TaxID=1245592 RepID=A0ABU4JFW0_9FLAO|nr:MULTISPECIES: hypothetical protein [Chryseobacterium group]RZL61976.1 MAG: hypothetical protein EOO93_11085 [Pedobacter sp.]MBV6879143.1 hypothetical protein [Epilithonimonas sp. FP105]MDW8548514.1 hypothetical protein [Epilithonimonas ginsengisoli]OAH75396.1 hypothetical protein AXA65_03425 [Chryseobacterium sp. FP211-J200]TXF77293.1 hypothetical protein FUA25_04970 [Chryseobacterium sp.]